MNFRPPARIAASPTTHIGLRSHRKPRGHLSAQDAQDDVELAEGKPRRGLGRQIILAGWAICIVWITIVTFSSVVPQIFWPKPQAAATLESQSCTDAHRELYDSMMEHAGTAARAARTDAEQAAASDAFFAQWDANYLRLSRCEGDKHARLRRLRYRIDNTLRRYRRDEGRLARALDDALGE